MPRYIERMVEKGRKLPLKDAVRKATLALGLGQSNTAQERWRAFVRANANVVFEKERVGRSYVVFVRRIPTAPSTDVSPPTFPAPLLGEAIFFQKIEI